MTHGRCNEVVTFRVKSSVSSSIQDQFKHSGELNIPMFPMFYVLPKITVFFDIPIIYPLLSNVVRLNSFICSQFVSHFCWLNSPYLPKKTSKNPCFSPGTTLVSSCWVSGAPSTSLPLGQAGRLGS